MDLVISSGELTEGRVEIDRRKRKKKKIKTNMSAKLSTY